MAASCVLFLHALANYGSTSGIALHYADGAPLDAARLLGRGYLGVDFFLMLSGFLMAGLQEERMAAGASPWRFMGKRYWRIWPMMALGGLIGLPRLFMRAPSVFDFGWVAAANMLLIPVPWHRFVTPLNVPAWTISCELLCNLAHVTLLWRLRGRWIWALVVALLPIEVWIGMHWNYYNVGAQPANFFAGLARCLFAYSLGIALSRWWRGGVGLPFPWWLALPLMPALLGVAQVFRLWGWAYDLGFILIACPLMMAGALRMNRFHGGAAWMGRIAFPLFALQMPILEGLRMMHGSYWIGIGLSYAAAVAAAVFSWWLARWKQRRTIAM